MAARKKLGEILLQGKIIDEVQLKAALGHQKKWGCRLGTALLELGFVSEDALTKFLSSQTRVPGIDLINARIPEDVFKTITKDVASKYGVIPLALKDTPGRKTLIAAMSNPTDLNTIDELEFLTTCKIEPKIAPESSIKKRLQQYGEEFLQSFKPTEPPPMDLTEEATAVSKIVEEKLAEVGSSGEESPVVVVDDIPAEASAVPAQDEPMALTEVTLEDEGSPPPDVSPPQELRKAEASTPETVAAQAEASAREYGDIVVVSDSPPASSAPLNELQPREVQLPPVPSQPVSVEGQGLDERLHPPGYRDLAVHFDTLNNEFSQIKLQLKKIQENLSHTPPQGSADTNGLTARIDSLKQDLTQVKKVVDDMVNVSSQQVSLETTVKELKDLIQVLLNYLIDKGIFTKEELVLRLKKGA